MGAITQKVQEIRREFIDYTNYKDLSAKWVERVAINIFLNDSHLLPFYTQFFLEGFLMGKQVKESPLVNMFFQRCLDLRRAMDPSEVRQNTIRMIDALKVELK